MRKQSDSYAVFLEVAFAGNHPHVRMVSMAVIGGVVVGRALIGVGGLVLRGSNDAPDDLVVILPTNGRVEVEIDFGATSFTVNPGEGFSITRDRSHVLRTEQPTEAIVLRVNAELVRSFGVALGAETVMFRAPTCAAPAAHAFFGALVDSYQPNRIAEYTMARIAEELTASLFLEALGVPPTPDVIHPALFREALGLIAARRSDPELDSHLIATTLHVSRRNVQRAFHEHGTTITIEIRRQRVAYAVDVLGNDAYRSLSVHEVALSCGFASSEDLRRALRAEGYATPRALRAAVSR